MMTNQNDAVITVLRALGDGAALWEKVDEVVAEMPAHEAEAVRTRCEGWADLFPVMASLARRRAWVERAIASIERLELPPHTQFAMDP